MKYKTIYLKAVIVEHDQPISDVPCKTINCTECCEKLSPFLTEDEFRSGKYVYTFLDGGDKEKPVIAVPKTERGCFYLTEDKKCSIYDIRPLSCRQFDCRKNHHHLISNKFEEKHED